MAVVGFIRTYTWLCAVCCFIVAMIFGANGVREQRAWVTAEARVVAFVDTCQMLPQIPPNEKEAVWGGIVPCAEVAAKKQQHFAYTYDVTPTRTFTLEFTSPDGKLLQVGTTDSPVRIPQTADLGHLSRIDYAIANPEQIRSHEGMRGLQAPILFNIFGICLLAFAWLMQVSQGGQATREPTGDWLSRVDLPPESIAGQKTVANLRSLAHLQSSAPSARREQTAPRQSAHKPSGFGRKT